MRTTILIGLVAGSWAAAAPGSKDKDAPPKPSPLVGEWEIVSQTSGGRTRPPLDDGLVWAFTADGKFADYGGGPKEKAHWQTYKADDKADPPTLDVIDPTRTLRCLYRIEGDTLTVCLPDDARGPRPAALDAGKGSKNLILTMKRVTPKK